MSVEATAEHVQRALQEMAARDVDVLILGREANARFLSGATRLWLAGTRPFNPGCVLVRATGAVHLLSTTDDLVPLPRERLYPMSWNPAVILRALRAIPGVEDARRVGVDGMTPLFEQLLQGTLPGIELVDGEELLAAVRLHKTRADVDAVRAAIDVAQAALGTALDALAPGVSERELLGAFAEGMTARGVTTPAFEAVFCIGGGAHPRSFSTGRRVRAGDLVDASVGVLANGWEGRLARTVPCGEPGDDARQAWEVWNKEWDAHASRVGPGTRVGDLRGPDVEVHGVGTGDELLADDLVLEPGVVLALGVRHAGIHGEDVLLVTESGHEVLTTFGAGPLASARA